MSQTLSNILQENNKKWLPILQKYQVFDLETENHTRYNRFASPFIEDNWIVARGWKKYTDTACSWSYFPTSADVTDMQIDDDVQVLVGHNVKFDLLYSWKEDTMKRFIERGGRIWCTQYAEYLLRAHVDSVQMNAMDDIVVKYGGRTKIDAVKKMWEAGYLTSEIPEDILIDYLVGTEEEKRNSGDIGNTELIYLAQLKLADELGMFQIIVDRMDGLLATTEMEFNGLYIDVQEAKERTVELHKKKFELEKKLNSYVPEFKDPEMQFNWNSGVHKSALMFGGTLKYKKQAPYKDDDGNWVHYKDTKTMYVLADGSVSGIEAVPDEFGILPTIEGGKCFKSGKKKGEPVTKKVKVQGERKVKYQDFFVTLNGYTDPNDEWQTSQLDGAGNNIYSTSSEVIESLANRDIPFVQDFVSLTALNKDLGYYMTVDKKGNKKGTLTCVNPVTKLINHSLNHTSTATSRLSSSNPNLQNLPRGDKSTVKKMFVSRFGENGAMMEADYSQLEVVVQGVLSGDKNLCTDLRNRVDFHCKRVSASQHISYEDAVLWCKDEDHPNYPEWKVKRTKAKNFSFQRAYGAGAKAIAESTGMSIEEVEELIQAEETMYPDVIVFNDTVQRTVEENSRAFYDPKRGKTYRRGTWVAPTGTRYSWRSWDAPDFMRDRGIEDTFSPPELKNYPIQGTGGEMVQVILGKLFRAFVERGWWSRGDNRIAVLVNTVHDCVWADMMKQYAKEVGTVVRDTMESIPEYYNKTFGMDITVPFPVDVEYGVNMNELHHLDLD